MSHSRIIIYFMYYTRELTSELANCCTHTQTVHTVSEYSEANTHIAHPARFRQKNKPL